MPESAPFQKFRSRIEYLNQHLQLVDIALGKLVQSARGIRSNDTIINALEINPVKYTRLNHPLRGIHRLTNFSRSHNVEMALISLYRTFGEYLRGILGGMYAHDPKMVAGKASGSFQYHEIIDLQNYQSIVDKIVDEVFRKLEKERSTTILLDKILLHTDVNLAEVTKTTALAYLELRHLIIHNHGRADKRFVDTYSHIVPASLNQKIPFHFRTAAGAMTAVCELVSSIDVQLIQHGHISPR